MSLASSGAKVGFGELIGMRLRRVSPSAVVNPRIAAVKAGREVATNTLESHYLAGGNVERVVTALISADKAGIQLDFQQAAAIDLAGRDVLEAVQTSVNPRVITTPKITAVAKDGIQLLVVTRITVRSNIDRLVGGATEETVVARVGEGIVSTIGSASNYAEVLENPDAISKNVLSRGLDSGTAFNILSIDIADVDVGTNIGAKLMTEQAEADKQVARGQTGRSGPRRGATCARGCPRARDARQGRGHARQAGRGRSPDPRGDGRRAQGRQPRRH